MGQYSNFFYIYFKLFLRNSVTLLAFHSHTLAYAKLRVITRPIRKSVAGLNRSIIMLSNIKWN